MYKDLMYYLNTVANIQQCFSKNNRIKLYITFYFTKTLKYNYRNFLV